MVDILVVAGCEMAVHAVGRQEGAGELRLGACRLHFRLLCLVTVVLEPDLDLCRARCLCLFRYTGEISSDLYRFVQFDIKKCAFDFLKLEQNP